MKLDSALQGCCRHLDVTAWIAVVGDSEMQSGGGPVNGRVREMRPERADHRVPATPVAQAD